MSDIREQIVGLRTRANDSYGGFLPAKKCGEVADTMEKLLAVACAGHAYLYRENIYDNAKFDALRNSLADIDMPDPDQTK